MKSLLSMLVLLMVLLAACGPSATLPPAGETPEPEVTPTVGGGVVTGPEVDWDHSPDSPVITVTNCCGFVPDMVVRNYIPEAVLYGDGRVVWSIQDEQGRRHVLQGQLSEEQVDALLAGVIEAGFFTWDEHYTDPMAPTDLPSKCVSVNANGQSHQVCEYFQGAPEAFHAFYAEMTSGAGTEGEAYIPTEGFLTAHPTPNPDRPLEEGEFSEWNAELAGLSLEEVVAGQWVEGDALLRAWDLVNAGPWLLVKDGESYYQVSLQIPGLSASAPPAP
jgi:hypothetical protein